MVESNGRVEVLIDYDNAKLVRREVSEQDVQHNLSSITEAVVDICRALSPRVHELKVRIYGGWIAQHGRYTDRAESLLRSLHTVRGIVRGVRVLPELALGLNKYCPERLIGLVRTDRQPHQQKMVDTLIAVDALHSDPGTVLAIVSDDDDLVPAAIAVVASGHASMHLIRRRAAGEAVNDQLCGRIGVTFATLPEEYRHVDRP